MKTFIDYLNEAKAKREFVFKINDIDVYFSQHEDGTHSFDDKLSDRTLINKQEFYKHMAKFIKHPDFEKSGNYALVKNKQYKVLCRYDKKAKNIFIYTILGFNMTEKKYDYKIMMDWFDNVLKFKVDPNTFDMIRDEELDITHCFEYDTTVNEKCEYWIAEEDFIYIEE